MEKEYKSDLDNYYMKFDSKLEVKDAIFKYWGNLTRMITGPDAEYLYL